MADTEYISKEAALACFSDWIDRYGHEHSADEMTEYQRIEDLPAADVVEVVRCKDCKLMSHDEHVYWCINDYQASLDPEKDYCSRAVRRTDNG